MFYMLVKVCKPFYSAVLLSYDMELTSARPLVNMWASSIIKFIKNKNVFLH